ncbi:hypothetical protein GYMLUDRAFT_692799 [Collybiopsis luxurians FD-317 M1]|uniref:Uncharacterized protein n=1 Tax=Collybiopsis luxurians FD-317 M1 TaxID=944289 RepID=A0A0D0BT97_9AGAR|nr:hypothetical protein GYMLUDRAFT_692799 [Collybiopsis luxurians FD-317 M1]
MPDVSLHALRRSHSDPSLVRTFQSEPHKKIIRRYASASSNLFNRSQTYSILGFLSPSLSSVDDDSEVPRVVVWPPSPASRAPSAGPSDNSPTSHRACVHEDSGTRQTIDSPVSDMSYNSPPFSPQSSSASAWETSSNSNSTSDFSRPNSPNFSPPRKFEVLLDFGRKNDSSGFYTPEYPHYWEGPPKQHERRKSTGDTLIPPLRTKHQDDYPRSPTPSSPPPFRLQTPTHSNSDGKS